jgi:hypothetical protein
MLGKIFDKLDGKVDKWSSIPLRRLRDYKAQLA